MAIVINGSGTVTGLSVGGLPDGTVDSGTLATNSVDSAELIDGAVDDSHIGALAASKLSGTVATARLPAGSLLQVATDYDGDIINMSNNSWNTTNLSIAFTPKRADSKIIVTAHLNLFMAGGGTQHGSAQAQIYKDSSAFGELLWLWCGYGGTEAQLAQASPVTVEEVSGSTSARTYSVQVRNYETQAGSTFNPYTGKSALIVMEIAV